VSELSKRDVQRAKREEIIETLLVIRSILFKFGIDDTAENDEYFVAFINELREPPVTITGARFTYMSYRQLMARCPEDRMRHIYDKITSEPYAIPLE
jgi:hypothetical protein